ncbi:MAG: glutamate--cysteine ligase [Planctomycetota bacterium]
MSLCQCRSEDRHRLLTKGVEEEVYTGTANGTVIGLSHLLAERDPVYETEPDSRNVEYRTGVHRCYASLARQLLERRQRLRRDIAAIGPYTLIPGGALALAPLDAFHISKPDNAYYRWIKHNYGSRVVTAGVHFNLGVTDVDRLLRAWRVLRLEACMFLACTAASPFLAGTPTGRHSTRWHRFPRTPARVPFLADADAFKRWVCHRLSDGQMQSHRHLWLAARPNGPASPCLIDRLELRICDQIWEPDLLLAMQAFYEALIQDALADPGCDPVSRDPDADWCALQEANENAVARDSLAAMVVDWRSGRTMTAAALITQRLERLRPLAADRGFAEWLAPLHRVLTEGNTAQQWLALHARGMSVAAIVQHFAGIMRERENVCARQLDPSAPDLADCRSCG